MFYSFLLILIIRNEKYYEYILIFDRQFFVLTENLLKTLTNNTKFIIFLLEIVLIAYIWCQILIKHINTTHNNYDLTL